MMIKVLVAYASKMGSTKEIAEAIGDELRLDGIQAEVMDAAGLDSLEGYDAAVVGSAVYMARWRSEAVKLLSQQAKRGSRIPIWLYQSGPCDNKTDKAAVKSPSKVQKLAAALDAALPVTFGGRLDPATATGFMAQRMAKGPLAGDFRDFDEIRKWTDGIAGQLAFRLQELH